MTSSLPTQDGTVLNLGTGGSGFMTEGTGLFDWERKIIGGSERKTGNAPEETLVQNEAEAEMEHSSSDAPNPVFAFWQRLKPLTE
jgi:hypothetical protein